MSCILTCLLLSLSPTILLLWFFLKSTERLFCFWIFKIIWVILSTCFHSKSELHWLQFPFAHSLWLSSFLIFLLFFLHFKLSNKLFLFRGYNPFSLWIEFFSLLKENFLAYSYMFFICYIVKCSAAVRASIQWVLPSSYILICIVFTLLFVALFNRLVLLCLLWVFILISTLILCRLLIIL